jgi:hypothetical protein
MGWGALRDWNRDLLHDRDTKFTLSFRAIIASGRVEPLALPVRSPNLNAYSERWARSVNEECLSKVPLIGERSLRRALSEYVAHYHAERNHQGKDNVLLFPRDTQTRQGGPVQCRERLGGLFVIIIKKPGDPVTGGRLGMCKDNYAAGKCPGVTEHCLRGRPVKPRRVEQQSRRFNFLESEPWINILTKRERSFSRAPLSMVFASCLSFCLKNRDDPPWVSRRIDPCNTRPDCRHRCPPAIPPLRADR